MDGVVGVIAPLYDPDHDRLLSVAEGQTIAEATVVEKITAAGVTIRDGQTVRARLLYVRNQRGVRHEHRLPPHTPPRPHDHPLDHSPTTFAWPPERFYWSVLEAPGVRRPGPLPPGLLPEFQEDLPVPVEEVHAVSVPTGDGRLVVCAAPRSTPGRA